MNNLGGKSRKIGVIKLAKITEDTVVTGCFGNFIIPYQKRLHCGSRQQGSG